MNVSTCGRLVATSSASEAVKVHLSSFSGNSHPHSGQMRTLVWQKVPQASHSFIGATPTPLVSSLDFGKTGSLIGPSLTVFRAKSRTKQFSFPGAGRVPRPSICTHKPGDIVGRSIPIKSISGKSKPVVKTALFTMQRNSPERNRASRDSRSVVDIFPSTIVAETPKCSNISTRCPACFRPAANTSQCFRSSPAIIISRTAASFIASLSMARCSSPETNSPPRIFTPSPFAIVDVAFGISLEI